MVISKSWSLSEVWNYECWLNINCHRWIYSIKGGSRKIIGFKISTVIDGYTVSREEAGRLLVVTRQQSSDSAEIMFNVFVNQGERFMIRKI